MEAAAGVGMCGDEQEVVANGEGGNVRGQLRKRQTRANTFFPVSVVPLATGKLRELFDNVTGYLRVSCVQVGSVRQAEQIFLNE